ncbi:MAG: metal ABC transporter permease [Verrucomicrobiae bacterium]|nr:metal ABC transporter permease [Verrucomicrobiae bacterium]
MMEMWHYDFMQRALLAAFLMGPVCGLLGIFITLRGMAFFSDAIAHSALTGIALGLFVEQVLQSRFHWVNVAWLQSVLLLVYCLIIALVMAFLFERAHLKADTIIAFCFTGSVALGVLIISQLQRYQFLEGALFGDINANSWGSIILITILAAFCYFFIFWNLRALTLTTLQEELARSDGIATRRLNYTLVIIIAATVALSIKLLGALLVSALIVIPAAAAKIVAPNFRVMLLAAMGMGLVASVGGVMVSYQFNTITGPTIVLCHLAFLIIALMCKKKSAH